MNESIQNVNETLQAINKRNMNIEILTQMWDNYQRNVKFHLEVIDELKKPL